MTMKKNQTTFTMILYAAVTERVCIISGLGPNRCFKLLSAYTTETNHQFIHLNV